MTANLWGIPYISLDVQARFEAMAQRLNADTSIDVVGLQEMWDSAARARFLDIVAAQYPYRVDFHGTHRRSGLMILSRRPFVGEPRFVPFVDSGKWWKPWTGEWWGGKGVGAVQVQADDGQPWVFVTHLHACYAGGAANCEKSDEYVEIRESQVQALRQAVNDIAGSGAAIILGDFNFTTRSPLRKLLEANGPSGSFDPPWQRIPEPGAPWVRIDYIWVRPGQDARWRELVPAGPHLAEPVELSDGRRVGISDHCPIATLLTPF
ncbi:MAG TPA: endonuclease/exonuclease/phosphatase family protein [Terriglobales bacterium]|nr:endonuclease/exonuclease/phosphatase family protein [Terriglobales bacterium]